MSIAWTDKYIMLRKASILYQVLFGLLNFTPSLHEKCKLGRKITTIFLLSPYFIYKINIFCVKYTADANPEIWLRNN